MFSFSAFASICEPLESLRAEVSVCEENPRFAASAFLCRDSYKTLVGQEQQRLKKLMGERAEKGVAEAQGLQLGEAAEDLSSSTKSLTSLLRIGKKVSEEIAAYERAFVVPVEAAKNGAGRNQLLRSFDCFGAPMKDLELVKKDLANMLQELEMARAVMMRHEVSAENRLKQAHNLTVSTAGLGKVARDHGAMRSRPRKIQSDITGIEKERKKAPSEFDITTNRAVLKRGLASGDTVGATLELVDFHQGADSGRGRSQERDLFEAVRRQNKGPDIFH